MTEDRVIELSIEAGFSSTQYARNAYKLERFAALVAAATQEECANLAQSHVHKFNGLQIAAAIRALK